MAAARSVVHNRKSGPQPVDVPPIPSGRRRRRRVHELVASEVCELRREVGDGLADLGIGSDAEFIGQRLGIVESGSGLHRIFEEERDAATAGIDFGEFGHIAGSMEEG